jgi:hypothetical protein
MVVDGQSLLADRMLFFSTSSQQPATFLALFIRVHSCPFVDKILSVA